MISILKAIHCYWLMFLETLEKCFLKALGLACQPALEKAKVELKLLPDTEMLWTVEKGIRGGICHSINRYAKDNKYMKDYNKNKESSYLKYWDVNNLYG